MADGWQDNRQFRWLFGRVPGGSTAFTNVEVNVSAVTATKITVAGFSSKTGALKANTSLVIQASTAASASSITATVDGV